MVVRLTLCCLMALCAPAASAAAAAPEAAPAAPAVDEAAYTADITKRADNVVAAVPGLDTATAARLHERLVAQYRNLRSRDDRFAAAIAGVDPTDKATLDNAKRQRDFNTQQIAFEFTNFLKAELSPQQIEVVKDKLTYNKVGVTYNGFVEMLPQLTDAQKEFVRSSLVEARELAIYGGSAEEKTKYFDKAKGRINNFLSKEGYDLKQASKDWAQRRKAAATTRPSN